MASGLNDKVTSYSIEKGIEFDQTYSLTPTQTGTASSVTFSLTGNAPTRVWDAPHNGGDTCWSFDWTTSSTTNTYYTNNTSVYRNLFNDGDYSIGFWFKVPTIPSDTSFYRMFELGQTSGILGFIVDLMGSANTNGTFTGSKLRILTGATNSTITYGTTQLVANTWYYFALRKTISGTTHDYYAYLNGTQFATWQESGTAGSTVRITFGRNGSHSLSGTYRLANFYSATSSVVGPTQIAEIWAAGDFGYRKGLANLGASPTIRYDFNDSSGIDVITNVASPGTNDLNLSATPTWTAYPNGKSRGSILLNPFSGYDAPASTTFGQSNTIAFWFKRSSAPASNTIWTAMYWNSETNLTNCYINTNGTISFQATLGSLQPALTSTTNVCDNQWHHVVITRGNGGVEAKMYIDGSLQSSQTWTSFGIPTTTLQPIIGLNNQFDEYTYFPSTTLTAQQVSDLYQSTISSTNISYPATPMQTLTPHAEFIMPTVTAESAVSVTYNSEAFGGNFNTADFMNPMLAVDVNLDAFGYGEATATAILPITTTETNLEYSASFMEASALATLPIISTEVSVDVSAMPMTASALLSSNVYFGNTVQDTSYNLNLRSISYTTNSNAHNGFTIGTQNDGATVVGKTSLLLQSGNGVPPLGTVIKAKFDPTKVTISPTGNYNEPNRFNVYVFTAAPSGGATWNNITYSNLPAKELIFTTKVVDDGLNPNYYLDITPAAQDSRAYTYGIFIEHVQDNFTGSNYYDRVEYIGTGLDTTLMYLLTTDHLSKNINADIMTATAEDVMPTVYVERYLDVNAVPAEASANMVQPTIEVEGSNQYISGTLTASAEAIQPAFVADIQYTSGHLEADARMGLADPIIYTEGIITFAATAMTASALFHDAQYNIGDGHEADHMNASALFVNPLVIINESVAAMVATVSVDMPDSTVSGELLGTAYVLPMTASAFLPTAPAYDPLTNDPWWVRLNNFNSSNPGVIEFFRESQNITLPTTYTNSYSGLGYQSVGDENLKVWAFLHTSFSPTPTGSIGFYDPYFRKAMNVKNIALSYEMHLQTEADRGFTLQGFINTTKADQVLFYGNDTSANIGGFGHTYIGLKNGKFYIKTHADQSLVSVSDSEIINGSVLLEATQTNIADGQWHHILIQRGYDNRTQIWIDGNLEIQRFGLYYSNPNTLGFNSNSTILSSDFTISGFAYNANRFKIDRDVDLDYYSAIKYEPVLAAPMTASVTATANNKAIGNRKRAIMLYWWEASAANQFARVSDNGRYGPYDYETFANLDSNANRIEYYGWDVYPVDITGAKKSNIIKPESYGFTLDNNTFWNPITGTKRYIDILNDVNDLDQIDAIFFRNFPDQSSEVDSYARNESVDSLFNVFESDIYDEFIVNLRKAIDTGISLYVTNSKLAVDLGIVDRVEEFRNISEVDGGSYSLELTGQNYGTSGKQKYLDNHTPVSFMVVRNTVEGLTDHPTYVWKDAAYWQNDDAVDFGGADRPFEKYDYRPNGLQIGDMIRVSDHAVDYTPRYYLQGVPVQNIKAGKAVTTYPDTYKRGSDDVANPYKDYALHIAVEPGDNLNGTQCGGKIFVSFTELFPEFSANLASPAYDYSVREYAQVDLISDYWINKAYETGYINLATRNQYLNASYNLNRRLEAAQASGNAELIAELNKKLYWSSNGEFILAQRNANISNIVVQSGSVGSENVSNRTQNVINPATGDAIGWRQEVFFTFKYSRQYPTMTIEVPPMATRGFWWLADRVVPEGLVERPSAANAMAEMKMPQVSAEKETAYLTQAMVALANITFPQNYVSGDVSIATLPLFASANMTSHVTIYRATPMTASALMASSGLLTSSTDEIVLYINHVDPILYLREEIIK